MNLNDYYASRDAKTNSKTDREPRGEFDANRALGGSRKLTDAQREVLRRLGA